MRIEDIDYSDHSESILRFFIILAFLVTEIKGYKKMVFEGYEVGDGAILPKGNDFWCPKCGTLRVPKVRSRNFFLVLPN